MRVEIIELYRYNEWANRRLLDAAAALSNEEFTRDLRNSFPSVRATLSHIAAAEWVWLQRWLGLSPAGVPSERNDADHAAVVALFEQNWRDQSHFLDRLTDASLRAPLAYRTVKGEPFSNPLWQLMRHVVNHSTYHRGQVVTLLRQLGHAPPSTDLVVWYRQADVPASA